MSEVEKQETIGRTVAIAPARDGHEAATESAVARLPLGTVISDDASPSFLALRFRLDAQRTTGPGRFVAVEAASERDEELLILGRVEDVHEVNPHEDPLSSTLREVLPFGTTYAGEGASTVIYRLATAEPLEEAVLDDKGRVIQIRSVTAMARAGARVYDAGPDLTVAALGLETDPDDGLDIGGTELVEAIYPSAETLQITQKATVEPTRLRTQSLHRLSFLGAPFDWRTALQPGAIVNIDCRGLLIGELRLITASIARDLQSLARQRRIPLTGVSIVEVHLVWPNDESARPQE